MIFLGADHGGLDAKIEVEKFLIDQGFEVEDLGTHSNESVDYPDYAKAVCKKVLEQDEQGILFCGSGIGISISANRFKGIRAALCRDIEDARLSREHNDSNVIVFGGRSNTISEILEMTKVWLETEFEGGRHQARVDKIDTN